MALTWSKVLEIAPKFLAAGLLPGLVSAPVAGAARGAIGKRSTLGKNILAGAVYSYPEMTEAFTPYSGSEVNDPGLYTTIDGKKTVLPAMNGAHIDRSTLNAVLAQSLDQHNKAVMMGNEDSLMEWWPGKDTKPRKGVNPISTAVKGIRINPDSTISIQFRNGKGKWYTYKGGSNPREASEAVKDLLTYPSIGRALPRKGHRAWGDSKHLIDKHGIPDSNVGEWGRQHYMGGWFAAK